MTLLEHATKVSQNTVRTNLGKYSYFIITGQYYDAYILVICLLFSEDNLFSEMEAKRDGNSEAHSAFVKQLKEEKLKLEERLSSNYHNNN